MEAPAFGARAGVRCSRIPRDPGPALYARQGPDTSQSPLFRCRPVRSRPAMRIARSSEGPVADRVRHSQAFTHHCPSHSTLSAPVGRSTRHDRHLRSHAARRQGSGPALRDRRRAGREGGQPHAQGRARRRDRLGDRRRGRGEVATARDERAPRKIRSTVVGGRRPRVARRRAERARWPRASRSTT